ncbi:MAG TPA: hypothetical protein VLA41_03885 [Burkholderiales bacterium]|nr:hypothetical protein [Burkholderiales bacterium]
MRAKGFLIRPELASRSSADHIQTAISLARDAPRRELICSRLLARPASAPLFDTARTVRALERAYDRMWSIRQAGEVPRAFNVDDAG